MVTVGSAVRDLRRKAHPVPAGDRPGVDASAVAPCDNAGQRRRERAGLRGPSPGAGRPAGAAGRSPMAAETDRHLLFGLLALQNGLIQQAQLVAAFHAWTCDKARPLADHLVALGYLTPEQRPVLAALAALHVEAHGDN